MASCNSLSQSPLSKRLRISTAQTNNFNPKRGRLSLKKVDIQSRKNIAHPVATNSVDRQGNPILENGIEETEQDSCKPASNVLYCSFSSNTNICHVNDNTTVGEEVYEVSNSYEKTCDLVNSENYIGNGAQDTNGSVTSQSFLNEIEELSKSFSSVKDEVLYSDVEVLQENLVAATKCEEQRRVDFTPASPGKLRSFSPKKKVQTSIAAFFSSSTGKDDSKKLVEEDSKTRNRSQFAKLLQKPKNNLVEKSRYGQLWSNPKKEIYRENGNSTNSEAKIVNSETKKKQVAEWSKLFKGASYPSKELLVDFGHVKEEEVTQKRTCPFYKKIPGTTFAVDAFSYGSIPGIRHYFLSHFHSDHYQGLSRKFTNFIYCSKVTANLVSLKIRLDTKYIRVLPLFEPVVIDGVEITLLDANHCPGSVMFLFSFLDGRQILHSGDFRACSEMESYRALTRSSIDTVYLDTTYCNPTYDFPAQTAILDYVSKKAVEIVSNNSKALLVCGSYTIGKERVFLAMADALKCKICTNPEKHRVLDCLEDDSLKQKLVTKWTDARIHVLPMRGLNFQNLRQHLSTLGGQFNEVAAFVPTGWEHKKSITAETLENITPKVYGCVRIYGVPYSEHSSFEEMKRFIQFLKPRKIIPTVNVGSERSRQKIKSLIQSWL